MEYWQTIFKVSETFRLDCPHDRKNMTLPSLEINQRILNILTSIESYEDHVGRKVSKLWGKSSKQINIKRWIMVCMTSFFHIDF